MSFRHRLNKLLSCTSTSSGVLLISKGNNQNAAQSVMIFYTYTSADLQYNMMELELRAVPNKKKTKRNSLLLNSLSLCFCVNLWKEGTTNMTISSPISALPVGSSSKTCANLCRSRTSSRRSKNRVNFSFPALLLDLSLGSSVIVCINGEKLRSK